jgi:hypothetical protein
MSNKKICQPDMSFTECELAILRSAIDKSEEHIAKKIVNTPEIKRMIKIVEQFISKKQLICYGGTAINNILPDYDKFYDNNIEIPDYDVFSHDALNIAKELVDVFGDLGFEDVVAKSGAHYGTFKVYVNFQSIMDITSIPKKLFMTLKKNAIKINNILYSPPNYLKMSMYLELSRPEGNTSRWEKVYKRLVLLNKHYPITDKKCADNFQRKMENNYINNHDNIYDIVKKVFIEQEVVFFGGYAISLYSNYMPKHIKQRIYKIPDFDVISFNAEKIANIIKYKLNNIDINNVKIIKKKPLGEVLPTHYEIKIGIDTIAFIYEPIACHSYNITYINEQKIKIATIDTLLSFYLAFLYINRPYYDSHRIICMANFLFKVQQKNRLKQHGLLKRFSIKCYGHQQSIEEMRAEKTYKFKELKNKKNDIEYEKWFLNYKYSEHNYKKNSNNDSQYNNVKNSNNDSQYNNVKNKKTRKIKKENKKTKKRKH